MDLWTRHLVPGGLTLFILLISLVPTRIPGYGGIAPLLTLISVYYWSIYRPDLLPAIAAFLLGLLLDIGGDTPMGVNALVFLLVHGLLSSQRRFFLGKPFLMTWWAFAVVAAVACWLSWVLVSLLGGHWIESRPVLFTYLMTLAFYPVLGWFLIRAQLTFLREA